MESCLVYQVISFFVPLVLSCFFVNSTRAGRAIRAIGDNSRLFKTLGLNERWVKGIVFCIGSAVAGLASILTGLVAKRLYSSPFGLVLKAIREDELTAISIGKNVRKFKVLAFAINSGLAAVAGTLYAVYVTYIDPTSFTLDESIFILSIVMVGGSGNLRCPVTGTLLMILLPEGLRFLGEYQTVLPRT